MKTTIENNIKKLVNEGIISVNLPKMGGVLIVNGIKFDKREYYSGRGSKYNKNINHEEVIITITQKEIAKAIRHFKAREKFRKMKSEAMAKAFSKSRPSHQRNFWGLQGTLQYAFTKTRDLHFPEMKEISRTKI